MDALIAIITLHDCIGRNAQDHDRAALMSMLTHALATERQHVQSAMYSTELG